MRENFWWRISSQFYVLGVKNARYDWSSVIFAGAFRKMQIPERLFWLAFQKLTGKPVFFLCWIFNIVLLMMQSHLEKWSLKESACLYLKFSIKLSPLRQFTQDNPKDHGKLWWNYASKNLYIIMFVWTISDSISRGCCRGRKVKSSTPKVSWPLGYIQISRSLSWSLEIRCSGLEIRCWTSVPVV